MEVKAPTHQEHQAIGEEEEGVFLSSENQTMTAASADGSNAKSAGLPSGTSNVDCPTHANTKKNAAQTQQQHSGPYLGMDELLADICPLPTEQPPAPSRPGAFALRTACSPMPDMRSNYDPRSPPITSREPQLQVEEETSEQDPRPISAVLVSEPPAEFDNCQICMAACDSGKGWEACQDQCVPEATFCCQNETLGGMTTVQEYADFIALFGKACPNATWTTHTVLWDGVNHTATFVCTYHCQHTESVAGLGPLVPTQKTAHSQYCYSIQTDPSRQNKIVHITKIWNDTWMLRDLGWTANEKNSQETGTPDVGKGGAHPESSLCNSSTSAQSSNTAIAPLTTDLEDLFLKAAVKVRHNKKNFPKNVFHRFISRHQNSKRDDK